MFRRRHSPSQLSESSDTPEPQTPSPEPADPAASRPAVPTSPLTEGGAVRSSGSSTAESSRRGLDVASGPRRRFADDAVGAAKPLESSDRKTTERRLIVGREISLAGEINACDHLVVEGRIEAKLKECRIIEVADSGVFKGSAEIEEADIAGQFDGDLSVRGKLRVRGSGTISGNIRYGRIEVEAGGRLIGTVQPLSEGPTATEPTRSETEQRTSAAFAMAGTGFAPGSSSGSAASSTPSSGVVHALSDGGGGERGRSESAD